MWCRELQGTKHNVLTHFVAPSVVLLATHQVGDIRGDSGDERSSIDFDPSFDLLCALILPKFPCHRHNTILERVVRHLVSNDLIY